MNLPRRLQPKQHPLTCFIKALFSFGMLLLIIHGAPEEPETTWRSAFIVLPMTSAMLVFIFDCTWHLVLVIDQVL